MFDNLIEAVTAYAKWIFTLAASGLNSLAGSSKLVLEMMTRSKPTSVTVIEGTMIEGSEFMTAQSYIRITFGGFAEAILLRIPAPSMGQT